MKTALAIKPTEEYRYMPLKLKGVLASLGIRQVTWAEYIKQEGPRVQGKSLSLSAATQIMNWGTWPKLTSRESIMRQTEQMLRDHDVDEFTINTIWDEDRADNFRKSQPVGIHVGQFKRQPDIDPLGETEMLSQHAKKAFGIFVDPFTDDVRGSEDIYLSADYRYIREAMLSAAKHGGFLAAVGESGAGKTVLRKDMAERITREDLPIVVIQPRVIDKKSLTAGAIFEAIIDDMRPGEKLKRSLEGKARQAERLLRDSSRAGNTHALVIEEAHDLSIQTLKSLKRFWELEDGFRRLLGIILIGQPELKSKLDERQNFDAREVIRRCEVAELMPLDKNLEDYLALKFKRVGKTIPDLFDASAFDAIRARLTRAQPGRATSSAVYPLVVNNLVTKAMNLAAEIGADKISADVIKEL